MEHRYLSGSIPQEMEQLYASRALTSLRRESQIIGFSPYSNKNENYIASNLLQLFNVAAEGRKTSADFGIDLNSVAHSPRPVRGGQRDRGGAGGGKRPDFRVGYAVEHVVLGNVAPFDSFVGASSGSDGYMQTNIVPARAAPGAKWPGDTFAKVQPTGRRPRLYKKSDPANERWKLDNERV